jgi:hypothetical protein
MIRIWLLVAVACLAWPQGASAFDIYINQHRIDGPVDKISLAGSTVKFNSEGDVLITAPDFEIKGGNPETESKGFQGQILLNGAQIRGVTDQMLEGCTVSFDGAGNLVIDAPQYKVSAAPAQGEQSKDPVKPETVLSNRYFLFTETDSPGKVPYDFVVSINGKEIKKVNSSLNWFTMEVTLSLKSGVNLVEIKSLQQANKTGAAEDTFKIRIGQGKPVNDSLEIRDIEFEFVRKGSDHGNNVDTFQLDAE